MLFMTNRLVTLKYLKNCQEFIISQIPAYFLHSLSRQVAYIIVNSFMLLKMVKERN